MNSDQFWTSQDGQILPVKNKDERTVTLTLGFWPRHPAEFEFLKNHIAVLKFTERSSMARIGIEMLTQGALRVEGGFARGLPRDTSPSLWPLEAPERAEAFETELVDFFRREETDAGMTMSRPYLLVLGVRTG